MKRHRFGIIAALWIASLLVGSPAHAQLGDVGDFSYRTQVTEAGFQDHVALVMATRFGSGDPLLAMTWGCEGGRLTIALSGERSFLRTSRLVGTARFDTGQVVEGLGWRQVEARRYFLLEGDQDWLDQFLQAGAGAGSVVMSLHDGDGRRHPTVHFSMDGSTEVVRRLRAACPRRASAH